MALIQKMAAESTKIRTVLSRTILFGSLPDIQLQKIEQIGIEKPFENGEMIFSEGDFGDGFYIVISGRIKIFKLSSDGKEQILHIFGAGEPFGEVPVFTGQKFPANASTIEKSTLFFLPRSKFIEIISNTPALALNMLAVLSLRLKQFTMQVENLSLKEVPGRLASYLLAASAEQDHADIVRLPISKGQLASLLGTIPETLSRILAKMSQSNVIHVNGPDIQIINREELAYLSGKTLSD